MATTTTMMTTTTTTTTQRPPPGFDVMRLPVSEGRPVSRARTFVGLDTLFQSPPQALAPPPPPPPPPPSPSPRPDEEYEDGEDRAEEEDHYDEDEDEDEDDPRHRPTLSAVFLSEEHQDMLWTVVERHLPPHRVAECADRFVPFLREFAATHALLASSSSSSSSSFNWETLEVADLCFLTELLGGEKNPDTTSGRDPLWPS